MHLKSHKCTQKIGYAFEIPQMHNAKPKKQTKQNFKKRKKYYGLENIEIYLWILQDSLDLKFNIFEL
jgi:hypothetical protein